MTNQNFDLHTHTSYCDGKNTAREMIMSAIDKGLRTIGLSSHGYTFYDESYCVLPDALPKYKDEIRGLKKEFDGKINVLLGIEADLHTDEDLSDYDYVVGSTHYVKKNITAFQNDVPDVLGQYVAERDGRRYVFVPVDETLEILNEAIDNYFEGDRYLFAEAYFSQEAEVIKLIRPDVIGHFDLVRKLNKKSIEECGSPLFDEESPRYKQAWMKALDSLLPDIALTSTRPAFTEATGFNHPVFEINLREASRGKTDVFFPSVEIQDYIKSKGGALIFSSDSHDVDTIGYGIL